MGRMADMMEVKFNGPNMTMFMHIVAMQSRLGLEGYLRARR